jgi:hypothetical protein
MDQVPLKEPGAIDAVTDAAALEGETRRLRAEVAALRQALATRDDPASDWATRATALETALLALPVGVAVFDSDDRLVIKNNRFQLYDATGERDRPGTRFEDILKFGIELRLHADARDDPERWMKDRAQQRRNPGPATIQELSDGEPATKVRMFDDRLVTQMLINLLTNSMRFVPEGGSIRLGLVLGDDVTLMSVKDNGAGMPQEDLGIILEPFQQGTNQSVRGHGGVGLGLSITKGMAELHGGTVTVESVEGEGTQVTLRFPEPSAEAVRRSEQ